MKCYIQGHYTFDDDNIVKTFYYYLTNSNYHDSSQINFNYFTSLFSLAVIGLIGNKYKIEIIYLISIIVIGLISLVLIFSDYLTEEDIRGKNNDPENSEPKNYGKLKLSFNFIMTYIIIYVLAGFISLLPNKLLDDYIKRNKITTDKNISFLFIFMNFVIGSSVTVKNFVNFYIIDNYGLDSISSILALEIIMFFSLALIFLLFLFSFNSSCYNSFSCIECLFHCDCYNTLREKCLNKVFIQGPLLEEDLNESVNYDFGDNNIIRGKKQDYKVEYLGGYIFVKTENIYSFIAIKGFFKYISSILTNVKIIFIFFINLCSRMQKLKFKTDYKKKITDNCWLFSIFLWSFVAYLIIYGIISLIIYCSKKREKCLKFNKDYEIEGLILVGLLLVFAFVFVFSIKFYVCEESEQKTLYISIVLTGSVNFLLYDYYSLQKAEYISLSGFVSISSLIFRLVEIIWEPFKLNSYYILQFITSLVGMILTLVYLIGFLTENIYICFCV